MQVKELLSSREIVDRIADAGIPRNTIAWWKRRNKIPARRVRLVERLTGVSREVLCPELYASEPIKSGKAA